MVVVLVTLMATVRTSELNMESGGAHAGRCREVELKQAPSRVNYL